MISYTTLQAVEKGVLTDAELNEAIEHYSRLERDLICHGEKYYLVWKDVFFTLCTLKSFREQRDWDKNSPDENG